MRIGVDGYNLAMPHPTGVGIYGYNLTRTIREIGYQTVGVFGLPVGANPALREVLFFDQMGRPAKNTRARRQASTLSFVRNLGTARAHDVPLTKAVERQTFAARMPHFDRLVSSAWLFSIAERYFRITGRFLPLRMEDPPEVMHWTYPIPVRLSGARNLYTVHDLVPLRLPFATLDVKTRYHALCRRCLEEGGGVITVSESSRRDILARFDVSEERVVNTYQSSHTGAPPADADADARMVSGVFGLPPRRYHLFFGAIEPKKNVGRLLEAHLSAQTGTPLVLVGTHGWSSEGELKLLPPRLAGAGWSTTLGNARVLHIGSVPRPMLESLIRQARAILFPSLYEGFGLPVLEAMQLGTPVLTSNTGSLPEVAGDAAVLVDPYDVNAIAAGLSRLDGDERLRERLSSAGRTQAEHFSQARYATRLADAYRTLDALK